jgi:hypothetical protein
MIESHFTIPIDKRMTEGIPEERIPSFYKGPKHRYWKEYQALTMGRNAGIGSILSTTFGEK